MVLSLIFFVQLFSSICSLPACCQPTSDGQKSVVRYRIDTRKTLFVETLPVKNSFDSEASVYIKSKSGKRGTTYEFSTNRKLEIKVITGLHGTRYIYLEYHQMAHAVEIYLVKGLNLVLLWDETSKGGIRTRFNRDGSVTMSVSRLVFQVYGPNDKHAMHALYQRYRFHNGKIKFLGNTRSFPVQRTEPNNINHPAYASGQKYDSRVN